jgi:hypothetical protein
MFYVLDKTSFPKDTNNDTLVLPDMEEKFPIVNVFWKKNKAERRGWTLCYVGSP